MTCHLFSEVFYIDVILQEEYINYTKNRSNVYLDVAVCTLPFLYVFVLSLLSFDLEFVLICTNTDGLTLHKIILIFLYSVDLKMIQLLFS